MKIENKKKQEGENLADNILNNMKKQDEDLKEDHEMELLKQELEEVKTENEQLKQSINSLQLAVESRDDIIDEMK